MKITKVVVTSMGLTVIVAVNEDESKNVFNYRREEASEENGSVEVSSFEGFKVPADDALFNMEYQSLIAQDDVLSEEISEEEMNEAITEFGEKHAEYIKNLATV